MPVASLSLPKFAYDHLRTRLATESRTWFITGVAGFIRSNLLETLLTLNQRVVGLDNFSTGHQRKLDEERTITTPTQWGNFHFIQGDIRDQTDCQLAMVHRRYRKGGNRESQKVDYGLLQAALGSVPRSLEDPPLTNSTNITGFLNILVAARDAKV